MSTTPSNNILAALLTSAIRSSSGTPTTTRRIAKARIKLKMAKPVRVQYLLRKLGHLTRDRMREVGDAPCGYGEFNMCKEHMSIDIDYIERCDSLIVCMEQAQTLDALINMWRANADWLGKHVKCPGMWHKSLVTKTMTRLLGHHAHRLMAPDP